MTVYGQLKCCCSVCAKKHECLSCHGCSLFSLLMTEARRNYFLLTDIKEARMPLRLQYQQLTNKDLDDYYDGKTAAMGPGHMLDVMESFHRLDSQVWRAALEVL
jgi:hypothetical protein